MNRRLVSTMLAAALCLTACGNNKTINGTDAPTYGLLNQDANKRADVVYEVSFGSVVCAILFIETAIVPVYIVGWDLWQPVRSASPA